MLKQILIPISILACSACSYDLPSQINSSRSQVEIVEGVESHSFETALLDKKVVQSLAHQYSDKGDGTLEVTVTYDPKSKKNTAMKATLEAARIADLLAQSGVSSVKTKVLPVSDSWNMSHTFLSFKTLAAQAPSDCDRLPGFSAKGDTGDSEKHLDYDYGCTVEAMIAKQVAHPQDLLGQGDETKTDPGRRAENVVSGRGYYGPEAFPALKGESSSD